MGLKETVDKIKSQDTEVFTDLVRQYQNLAFGYAFSILKDFHRAQDAVQEAFIVAYYQIDQLEDPLAFPGWLRGIVRNQCYHLLRGKMNRWEPIEGLEENPSDVPGPEQILSHKEQNLALSQAIRSLPERQQEVISLFYIEENSQQDVAAFLELSISDVNNSLHAARKTLKKRMVAMDQKFKTKLPKDFAQSIGKIVKVQGRLVDAELNPSFKPVIFDDLSADKKAESKLTVVQRLKDGRVRCLVQGQNPTLRPEVTLQNQGSKSSSSMGEDAIKEVVLALGTPAEKPQIFVTGIKIIDLLCPFPKKGSIGLMGKAGSGRSALVAEMYKNFVAEQGQLSIFFFVAPNDASNVSAMIEHEPDLVVDEGGPLQTVWLITRDAAEPGFAKSANYLEARPFFSASMAAKKHFPAVDPIQSHSRLLDPAFVGKDHYATAMQVRELLLKEETLDDLQAARARKLRNFFTQPFHVMAASTQIRGISVPLEETLKTCSQILSGDMDAVPERSFLYVGGTINK